MKRLLAIFLIMGLMVGCFAGCSTKEQNTGQPQGSVQNQEQKNNEQGKGEEDTQHTIENFNPEGFPIVNDKITLKMMGTKAPIQGPWEEMYLFQEMEEKTNIQFTFDTPPVESYQEKKNLAFASGELPDVFFAGNLSVSDEIMYGGQGMLIPLEDLIDEYAPNLKKRMEENPDIRRSITTKDGHIYALPQINEVLWDLTTKIWINQEWMDKLGLKMPETVDDYYQLLKTFKTGDPNGNGKADEIPLTFDNGSLGSLRPGLLSAFGLLQGDGKVYAKDNKVVYVPIQEGYKEYLQYMNQLYKENLLDEECFTQTPQQVTAKGNEGRVGSFAHAGAFLVVPYDQNEKYPALPPLTSQINSERIWPRNPGMSRGAAAITKRNKHPEATMRWLDYFYSEEGSMLLSQGPEGIGWKWADDNKEKWVKIEHEGFKNTEEFRGGKVTPNCGSLTPGLVNNNFISKLDIPHVYVLKKEVGEKYAPYWKVAYPLVYFTEQEQGQLSTLSTDLNTYVDQMEAKFIIGEVGMDKWDEYVHTVKQMGADELVKIYQDAYDSWKGSN